MKAGSSYASILRGVSQQTPQDRTEGQHTEQINMLSDPVNGLARRHGSVWQAEFDPGLGVTLGSNADDITEVRSFDFSYLGQDYLLTYRKGTRGAGTSHLPALVCYNKTAKAFLPTVLSPGDSAAQALEANGVAALTNVGKYLFLSANAAPVTGQSVALWGTADNYRKAVAWVRGGAFSRTYTIKVNTQTAGVRTASYTTPASSYPGTLSTSDIAATDPEYTKKVNDRVNAYNAAVTAWIGTSTAAIQPAAIAQALADQLNALVAPWCTVVGSHLCFVGDRFVQSIEVDDGGDGSLFRAVADEIDSADKTSVIHYPGKVVKVRAASSKEAYYLKAVAKGQGTVGYQEVSWVEGAGEQHSITGGLCLATVHNGGLYLASSAAALALLVPGEHPTFQSSTVGDSDTSPQPHFVGRQVTYLGTFQNRLLVGSGGVLALSRTEDYLNFYRSTVLTVPGDDPFEMLPTGSEADELRYSALYDQDLVIFGTRRQYVVSGAVALSPTSAAMPVMSSYEGIVDASPKAAGGVIFYAKRADNSTSLHQIQPGQNNKSPESYPVSSQLDDYLQGGGTDIVVSTGTPSILCLRTTANRHGIYTFSYLDKVDARKMDSWAKWEFNPVLGYVMGMSVTRSGVVVTFLRQAPSGRWVLAADLVPVETKLSTAPYLDSQRPVPAVAAYPDAWAIAISSGIRKFTGAVYSNRSALDGYVGDRVFGAVQAASFTPTNPYVRDSKGKAVLSGRTTVGKMTVATKQSIGADWALQYFDTETTGTFSGRTMGLPSNLIGSEPVTTGAFNIPVARETNDYTLTIKARRWYPLTVTALEWTGQLFNRLPRV